MKRGFWILSLLAASLLMSCGGGSDPTEGLESSFTLKLLRRTGENPFAEGSPVEIARVSQALESFYAAHDRYPTNEEGIDALPAAPALAILLAHLLVAGEKSGDSSTISFAMDTLSQNFGQAGLSFLAVIGGTLILCMASLRALPWLVVGCAIAFVIVYDVSNYGSVIGGHITSQSRE